MRGDHKHGNGWYYGESEVIRRYKGAISFQIHQPRPHRDVQKLALFDTLQARLLGKQRQAPDKKTSEDITADAADETKLTLSRRDIEKTYCLLRVQVSLFMLSLHRLRQRKVAHLLLILWRAAPEALARARVVSGYDRPQLLVNLQGHTPAPVWRSTQVHTEIKR